MGYPHTLSIEQKTPYETGTTQIYPLGLRALTPDGRVFRYSEMGAVAGIANRMYQSSLPVANWTTQAHTVALAAGDTEISFKDGGTAFVADEAAGGTITVEETDDLGHIYRVKSNTATVSNETIMQLEDGVTVKVAVAVAAGNVLSFLKNPWKDILIVPTTTPTALVIGIPPILIAANAFGWVQSRGVASCLVVGSALVGQPVISAGTSTGSIGPGASQTTNITGYWGRMLSNGVTGDFGAVFLNLE